MASDSDYIGTESSTNDLVSHNESPNAACTTSNSIGAARQYSCRKKKEFPPPLPLLARTESLSSHMPWELKRYYTSDGRLILREEWVRHHDYFKAHRENGRLILQLIPLDHTFHEVEPEPEPEPEPEQEPEQEPGPTSPPRTDNYDDDDDDDDDDESYRDRSNPLSPGTGRFRGELWNLPPKVPSNGATKCKMNFTRVASAPCCLFEMPLHAVRTVHG